MACIISTGFSSNTFSAEGAGTSDTSTENGFEEEREGPSRDDG